MQKVLIISIIAVALVGAAVFVLQGGFGTTMAPESFVALTREDPLFYSPFFDAEEFTQAIENLRESEGNLKQVVIENILAKEYKTRDYVPILEDEPLFPYNFLERLVSIPPKTEAFLKNPTKKQAEELLGLYDDAVSAYNNAIDAHVEVFNTMALYMEQNRQRLYFFVDNVSSFEIVQGDLLTIQENGRVLREEVQKRRDCLIGKLDCAPLITTVNKQQFFASLDARPDLTKDNVSFIRDILSSSSVKSSPRGPYLVTSSCWQGSGSQHWIYFLFGNKEGTTLTPKLVHQNYYHIVPTQAVDPIHTALLEQGISYYSQPGASTYECMDLTFYPQILTLDFIAKQIEQGVITREDTQNDPVYALLIENQFGLLAPVLDTIAGYLGLLTSSQEINDDLLLQPEFLYPTRMAYSIMYFPFAHSIWRTGTELTYMLSEEVRQRISAPSRFITLDELKALGYSEADIKKFHLNQGDFIRSLIPQ